MLEKTLALKEKIAKLGLRYVPGIGQPTSKLWIVGDIPLEQDVKALQPFQGKEGGFLGACMGIAGVEKTRCYLTNLSPVRAPGDNAGNLDAIALGNGCGLWDVELALREQIAMFKPNCVLAFGESTMRALTGKVGLRHWRGYVQGYESTKVIASLTPRDILDMADKSAKKERENKGETKYTYGTARMLFILDTKRAKEESEWRGFEPKVYKTITDLESKDVPDFIEKISAYPEVAFDVETANDSVDSVGLSCTDLNIAFGLQPSYGVGHPVFDALRRLFSTHKGLIAQNGGFDMGQLKKIGLPINKLFADTMIAHHLLYPEWPHGLDFLSSIYLRLPEPPHAPGWDLPPNRARSNALHAAYTLEIWKLLEAELKENEKWSKN